MCVCYGEDIKDAIFDQEVKMEKRISVSNHGVTEEKMRGGEGDKKLSSGAGISTRFNRTIQ